MLLDVLGRWNLDEYVEYEQERTRNTPSRQSGPTCYAHAAGAVVYMALHRIVGRVEDYPTIREIRTRIMREFPWHSDAWRFGDLLTAEEIIRKHDDHSIFAWTATLGDEAVVPFRGILTESPHEFADAGSITPLPDLRQSSGALTMTNKGLQTTSTLVPYVKNGSTGIIEPRILCLGCARLSHAGKLVGIEIVSRGGNRVCRAHPSRLIMCNNYTSWNVAHGLCEQISGGEQARCSHQPATSRDSICITTLPEDVDFSIFPLNIKYDDIDRVAGADMWPRSPTIRESESWDWPDHSGCLATDEGQRTPIVTLIVNASMKLFVTA